MALSHELFVSEQIHYRFDKKCSRGRKDLLHWVKEKHDAHLVASVSVVRIQASFISGVLIGLSSYATIKIDH